MWNANGTTFLRKWYHGEKIQSLKIFIPNPEIFIAHSDSKISFINYVSGKEIGTIYAEKTGHKHEKTQKMSLPSNFCFRK